MRFVSVHQNYVGSDGDKVPFFLSVVLTDANNQCVPQYRAILWKKTVSLLIKHLLAQFFQCTIIERCMIFNNTLFL
jgi:hypothetical protein